jgi:hypothetical protein
MRPNPKEEGLVTGRLILLRFHERNTALHVAQSHALPRHPHPRPARHGRRHRRLRARAQPTELLGRCVGSCSRVRVSPKQVPQQRRFSSETSLFALSYVLSCGL